MELHKFIASSAPEAVRQIRKKLGPNAVVIQVQPSQASGIRRFWGKGQIEVLAHVPPPAEEPDSTHAPLEPGLLNRIPEDWLTSGASKGATLGGLAKSYLADRATSPIPAPNSILTQFIQNSGLLPCFADDVALELEKSKAERGEISSQEEIKLFHRWMSSCWRASTPKSSCGIHLFIGAPGVGKSVILSKWLSMAVLNEHLTARVVRLDGETANVADSLEVFCDMLGATVTRSLEDVDLAPEDVVFIDLPGADPGNKRYQQKIKQIVEKANGAVQIHLVLNAAYDSLNLLRQCRAVEPLVDVDLIITRLDEEERWGKIWNLFLGTKFSLCYLNAGQNIPGQFTKPDLGTVLQQELPIKTAQNKPNARGPKVGKPAAKVANA